MARRVVKLHSKYESYQTFEDILDQLEEGEKMNKKCCGWCFICSFKDIGKICGCCGSNRETGDDDLECALVNYVQVLRSTVLLLFLSPLTCCRLTFVLLVIYFILFIWTAAQ